MPIQVYPWSLHDVLDFLVGVCKGFFLYKECLVIDKEESLFAGLELS